MYYREYGTANAKALVLLHSGGMAGEEWKPQIPLLSKRYRLIVPDLPGHGQSPLQSERLTIDGAGREVIALLDALGLERAALCGSSLGGAVALWVARNAPQRLSKLVIYRITYRKNTATHAQTQQMADPAYWQAFGLQNWLAKLHEPQGGPEAWKTVIARVSDALNPEHSAHAHRLQDLASLRLPTLLIAGDRDPVAPLEDVLAMYHTLPNAGLWVMPYATHITASNTWRAQAFAEELIRFLSRPKEQETP